MRPPMDKVQRREEDQGKEVDKERLVMQE